MSRLLEPRAALASLAIITASMIGLAQLTGRDGAKPHPLGTEVVVGHTDAETGVRTRIGLTVLAVRTGTVAEVVENGILVSPDDMDATPYYVDARFSNQGPNAVQRNLSVGLEDSRGNLIPATIILSVGDEPFEQCPQIAEATLEPGESYESCTLVLVPRGVEVGKVEFLSDRGPDEEPEFVYWAVE